MSDAHHHDDLLDVQDELELSDLSSELQTLEFDVQDGVAVITINRPEALNALNAQVLYELGIAFELAQADLGVQALVITGERAGVRCRGRHRRLARRYRRL